MSDDPPSAVLEANERLILDAMRGDYTLFTGAEGIEPLWQQAMPLIEAPPPVRLYMPGSWCPNVIHSLIAPHAWRLPLKRAWRGPAPRMESRSCDCKEYDDPRDDPRQDEEIHKS